MTINILVVNGGTAENDLWTDAPDNIRLVVVNWDDVSRDMLDGHVDRLTTLHRAVEELPDSPVKDEVGRLLATAIGGAFENNDDLRTVETPRDQLGVLHTT